MEKTKIPITALLCLKISLAQNVKAWKQKDSSK